MIGVSERRSNRARARPRRQHLRHRLLGVERTSRRTARPCPTATPRRT
jgi:hypothetical protein